METHKLFANRPLGIACAIAIVTGCGGESHVGSTRAALTAACVPSDEVPAGAWVCPETATLECDEIGETTVYVVASAGDACAGESLALSQSGPFAPGTHVIVVDEDGEAECTTELTVVDSTPPRLAPRTIELWPPNHALHEIDALDCVRPVDACDGELRAEFIWASSDEPVDDIGDGHHQPDIALGDDCATVLLRAERQGPRDGRVYRLGVRVTDAAGNAVEGECAVIVDHDQRGVDGRDSGEAYRLTFDGSEGGPTCGGSNEPPAGEDAGIDEDA